MNTVIFGPWTGEFSYEAQWWIPEIRQLASEIENIHVVVIGFPGREALYRDFIHEYIPMPPSVLEFCQNPNCWSQKDPVTRILSIPIQALQFLQEIHGRYEKAVVHTPSPDLIERRFLDRPYGLYKNIDIYDTSVDNIINSTLNEFDRSKTICLVPKLRRRDGLTTDHETWPAFVWEDLINYLTNDLQFNVLSFLFPVNGSAPGTYNFNEIEKSNLKFRQIYLNVDKSLDLQIGLLKNTLCSIYGSTGAAILPMLCNTKMFTAQHLNAGWRLNFAWQRDLTDNHRYIDILNVTADDFQTPKLDLKLHVRNYLDKIN